jgi:nitrate reductase gamma subunit
LGRVIRRFARPVLRLISSPDDYFSVMTITVWLFTGVLAQALLLGYLQGTNIMVVFLYTTSFFLIYVPFSKISHYLYYPFIRWYLGKTLGHRGSMPVNKS